MIARHIGRIVGRITDHALNQLWPLEVHTRHYLAQVRVADKAAADLAEAEAAVEVAEPLAAEDFTPDVMPDDLWAAEQRHNTIVELGDDQSIDDLINFLKLPADSDDTADLPPVAVSNTVDVGRPAGAVVTSAASASGAGGTSTITNGEVAAVIAVILRLHGIDSAPIYADLAAWELAHHFTFHRK